MTYAPAEMLTLARRAEAAIPSAVFSGIVGDASHTYGFHCSARQLGFNRGDYSLANADNYAGGQKYPDAAAAVDLSMNRTDMIAVTRRLVASWQDPNDDRLNGWYSFIGTLDGVNGQRRVCYPPEWGGPYWADNTHTWHLHASCRRGMVHDTTTMNAFLSVIVGESYAFWKGLGGAMTDVFNAPDMYGKGPDNTTHTYAAYLRNMYYEVMYGQGPARGAGGVVERLKTIDAKLSALDTKVGGLAASVVSTVQTALNSLDIQLTPEQLQRVIDALVARADVPLGVDDEPAIRRALETVLSRTQPRSG